MEPVAVCRFCAVDIGARTLVAACHRPVEEGMKVSTGATSDKVKNSVKILTELLLVDNEVPRVVNREYGDNELRTIAKNLVWIRMLPVFLKTLTTVAPMIVR